MMEFIIFIVAFVLALIYRFEIEILLGLAAIFLLYNVIFVWGISIGWLIGIFIIIAVAIGR